MSTIVGGVVLDMKDKLPQYEGYVIASALSILTGSIVLGIGLLRCGWIVDLIPLTALSAFMTGSAISIAVGQVPALMGITGFSTRDAPYLVIINTLKGLPNTKLDAAMGLTALTMLYLIRIGCSIGAKRMPEHKKLIFFLSTLRTAFVILLYTGISAGVNINRRTKPAFKILMDVPRGKAPGLLRLLHDRFSDRTRFPTRRRPDPQQGDCKRACVILPRQRHCPVDRAHRHLEVVRPH
jgi:solute carrier family 26 (sodium-independent sulfate anion transporter), member 11